MKILVADIDSATRWLLCRGLKGHVVLECATLEEARFLLKNSRFDVVFLARNFPEGDGFDLIREFPHQNFVILTANPAIDRVSEIVKERGCGYIKKPLDLARVREFLEGIEQKSGEVSSADDVILYSLPVRTAAEKMESLIRDGLPFMVFGERGVGKRTILKYVLLRMGRDYREVEGRRLSGLPDAPSFLIVSGVQRMCPCMQDRLADELLEGRYPSGVAIVVDGDPLGLFREGLLSRGLYGIFSKRSVEVPPLRERREDIPLLVEHFRSRWERERGVGAPVISEEVLEVLKGCGWSGNVEQLKGLLFSMLDRYSFEESLGVAHLPVEILAEKEGFTFLEALRRDVRKLLGIREDLHERVVNVVERVLLEEALARTEGNRVQAARFLGLHRNTIRNKIKKLFGGEVWT